MLDKHFDDKAGHYLDGKSDQTIADELKVPRIFIERIREAAYGPIRVDPEVQKLMDDVDRLMKAHNLAAANVTRIGQDLDELYKRLAALGAKRAA